MAVFRKYAGASAGKGPSPILWNQIPPEVVQNIEPSKGFMIWQDGLKMPTSTTSLNGFTTTVVNGTILPANTEGGGMIFTCAGAENDGVQLQSSECFYVDADSNIVCECRIAGTDVDQEDTFFGLATTDTTICAGVPNDILGFISHDGDANIDYLVSKDGAGSAVDTTSDLADATAVRLGFKINGESSVEFYINGVKTATVSTGLPNDEALALSIAHLAGAAAANNLTVTWFYGAQWYDDVR